MAHNIYYFIYVATGYPANETGYPANETGYPANETGYPAGYKKRPGYQVQPYFDVCLGHGWATSIAEIRPPHVKVQDKLVEIPGLNIKDTL